jgi:hypothetical protein
MPGSLPSVISGSHRTKMGLCTIPQIAYLAAFPTRVSLKVSLSKVILQQPLAFLKTTKPWSPCSLPAHMDDIPDLCSIVKLPFSHKHPQDSPAHHHSWPWLPCPGFHWQDHMSMWDRQKGSVNIGSKRPFSSWILVELPSYTRDLFSLCLKINLTEHQEICMGKICIISHQREISFYSIHTVCEFYP